MKQTEMKESGLDPIFIVTEQPHAVALKLSDCEALIDNTARRERGIRQKLIETNLGRDTDARRMRDFLKELLDTQERRCGDIVRAMRAREAAGEPDPAAEKWLARMERLHTAVWALLTKYGVTEYVPTGQPVVDRDDIHEQVAADGAEKGTIVTVLKPAYLFRGEVLSPSVVDIAE